MLFAPLFETRRTSTLKEVDFWLKDALVGGYESSAGALVNEGSALGQAAVWAAVRVLSETVAQLPLKVYRLLEPAGKTPDPGHPLWTVLHDLANPEMTAYEFRCALQGHLALYGNAYAEIQRDQLGRVVALWPLRPDRMEVTRDEAGSRVWLYRLPAGTEVKWTWASPTRQPAPIWHLRGFGSDGSVGYSPLQLLREPLGLAMAAEEYGARLFSNAARPSGVLQTPNRLTPEAASRLKSSWEAAHRGLSNANRTAVLEEGVTWQQVGMPPDDAQFIESRKFSLGEIARCFRVPPHMIGDLDRATFSNIEHQSIDFVVHTLMPWLVAWEQSAARDLLSVKSFATHQIRFTVQGLLRGDIKSRYDAYAVGRQWGWLSADDVRELEDMNPLPEGRGQMYLSPLNMVPAGEEGEALDDEAEAEDGPEDSDGE